MLLHKTPLNRIGVLIVLLMFGGAVPALAQLERVGPTNPVHGYPDWYQDTTGVATEFCTPLNQAELDGGWCLLLPADTVAPEVFPTQFFDEHFYWSAGASINYSAGGVTSKALLTLALEGAFVNGAVVPGDQITFTRIRVNIKSLPFSGTYTVYHPYGVKVFPNLVAGQRLFYTEDVGIACPGNFTCALNGFGPFLAASTLPGGAELPPIAGPVPGKLYVADPARLGPATGSPVLDATGTAQNYFRIVGPGGWTIETSDFTLQGRYFTGTIPGKVSVNRATYARTAAGTKLDVFATAFPTSQSRLPASPKPAAVTPVLGYYTAPCVAGAGGALGEPAGATLVQMTNTDSDYWGQIQITTAPPSGVCVEDYTARDPTGQVVPTFYDGSVTDEVTISEALFDPAGGGSLSVKAVSSDQAGLPVLTAVGLGDLVSGQLLKTPRSAPPSRVTVKSANGGMTDLLVTTGVGSTSGGGIPVAGSDSITLPEDSPIVSIPVLANDTLNGSPIVFGPPTVVVTIVGAPRLGTAAVAADGTISYTPSPNLNGVDGIGYTVSVNGAVSAQAYVTINITPVNDPPVAVADTASGVPNLALAINVLANDTDVDGQADLSTAVIVTPPVGATAVVGAGGIITFTAAISRSYSFTYSAVDKAGAQSNPVTVTINIAAAEGITIARADFVRSTLRWRVSGTDTVLAGQTLTIAYDNGRLLNGTLLQGTVIGTAVVDATGAWALDLRVQATDIRNASGGSALFSTAPTRIRVSSPLLGLATANIALK